MKEFYKIFKKVGGLQQLKQYAKARVLFLVCLETIVLGISKKSLEIVRLIVENRIYCRLQRKYNKFILRFKEEYDSAKIEKRHDRTIWIAWFQGMENAPLVVKKCYDSICSNCRDWNIVVLTEENYSEYVAFPDYITEKYKKGIITKTHLSDLLRMELLATYGGTWIDATVFCTSDQVPSYMMESDLFMYQILKPGLDGHRDAVSSWFITASADNKIIRLVRALLYEYWKNNNHMIDYFLIHQFFQMAIETYPDVWKKVVPFSSAAPHVLLLRLFEEFDEEIYNATVDMTPFHKLSYKYSEDKRNLSNTFYSKMFGGRTE